MATKQFYATKDFKYGTRMMRAGDTVEMTGPHAKLYRALNAISPTAPKREPAAKTANEARSEEGLAPIPAATKPKAAPRKRTAKKRATAKK